MAASSSDLFKKLTNNFSTTLSGAIVGSGDTSMSLSSTANLPTDTGTVFVIDRVNSSGIATPSLREYVKGTGSGSNIINLVRGIGNSTAQAHLSGAVVEQVVDQNTINDISSGVLVQHNQDGTHGAITATSVSATGTINASAVSSLQDASIALSTYRKEYFFDYIASGGVWSGDSYGSTLNASMTALVCYINGQRLTVSSVTAHTFTASKDTYIDVLNTAGVGSLVYTEVTNNAASPALAANSLRLAIVVTGANIANAGSVNQGQETMVLPIASSVPYCVTDSLGNLICPRDPSRKILGYKQFTSTYTAASIADTDIPAFSSIPIIAPGNRKIKITFCGDMTNTSGADTLHIKIKEGATVLEQFDFRVTVANIGHQGNGFVAFTPTAGLHTYKVSLSSDGANFPSIFGSSTLIPSVVIELE